MPEAPLFLCQGFGLCAQFLFLPEHRVLEIRQEEREDKKPLVVPVIPQNPGQTARTRKGLNA